MEFKCRAGLKLPDSPFFAVRSTFVRRRCSKRQFRQFSHKPSLVKIVRCTNFQGSEYFCTPSLLKRQFGQFSSKLRLVKSFIL